MCLCTDCAGSAQHPARGLPQLQARPRRRRRHREDDVREEAHHRGVREAIRTNDRGGGAAAGLPH
uniref:Uncharacterized protein n=1 Tax=Arundo donax TaxID=35708 RepID=A0A0A9GFZ5_ARUDO